MPKKKPTRASLTKKLREQKIPIPSDATISELEHRLDAWLPGQGYVIRLIRTPRLKAREQVCKDLAKKVTYWVPNSHYAQSLLNSGIIFVSQRSAEPPADATVLEIPKGE